MAVLGVDICRGAWVGVILGEDREWLHAYTAKEISELVTLSESFSGSRDERIRNIAIDIPIGLPDSGSRSADVEARKQLGRRGASVFTTPTRAALGEPEYQRALLVQREHRGAGISRQAHALRERILEVDRWLALKPDTRVIEVHPELSFMRMFGRPADYSKKTWGGFHARWQALRENGVDVPAEIGDAAATAGLDDVLDAAAAAWTASTYPDAEHVGGDEDPWRIWY